MTAKIKLTAPSAEGIGGNSLHKTYKYITYTSEKNLTNQIDAIINSFVMLTGVNKDMVHITLEKETD